MDGGAWWAAVHGVAKSRTRLSDFTFTFHFHALEKKMATHSSVLAWRIPGTGEPGGLPSVGSHRVGHDWSHLAAAAAFSSDLLFSATSAVAESPPCDALAQTLSHSGGARGSLPCHWTLRHSCFLPQNYFLELNFHKWFESAHRYNRFPTWFWKSF